MNLWHQLNQELYGASVDIEAPVSLFWHKLDRELLLSAQLSYRIPTQIRLLRQARGWTQAELGRRTGMAQPTIAHLEQVGRLDFPSLTTLERIAQALDIVLLAGFQSWNALFEEWAMPPSGAVLSFAAEVAIGNL